MAKIEEKLREMGLELPGSNQTASGGRFSFRPARHCGNLLYISGQGPARVGEARLQGKVGSDLTVEQGYEAAKLTGLNLLRVIKGELGDLDRVVAWVKVLGFVNSAPGFNQQPAVMNGFSDLILQLYGPEVGGHARSAIGAAELPMSIPVEIEAIVEVSGD